MWRTGFFYHMPTGDVNRNDQIGVNSQAPGGHALLAPVPCIAGDATDILKLATLSSACVLLSSPSFSSLSLSCHTFSALPIKPWNLLSLKRRSFTDSLQFLPQLVNKQLSSPFEKVPLPEYRILPLTVSRTFLRH